jgi:hypothetical protein
MRRIRFKEKSRERSPGYLLTALGSAAYSALLL